MPKKFHSEWLPIVKILKGVGFDRFEIFPFSFIYFILFTLLQLLRPGVYHLAIPPPPPAQEEIKKERKKGSWKTLTRDGNGTRGKRKGKLNGELVKKGKGREGKLFFDFNASFSKVGFGF